MKASTTCFLKASENLPEGTQETQDLEKISRVFFTCKQDVSEHLPRACTRFSNHTQALSTPNKHRVSKDHGRVCESLPARSSGR